MAGADSYTPVKRRSGVWRPEYEEFEKVILWAARQKDPDERRTNRIERDAIFLRRRDDPLWLNLGPDKTDAWLHRRWPFCETVKFESSAPGGQPTVG